MQAPNPKNIYLEDIATSLAHQGRFCGHTKRFYSIAQHSVLVSHHCDYPREGLMHDGTETYVGDVSRPLKLLLGLGTFYSAVNAVTSAEKRRVICSWVNGNSKTRADRADSLAAARLFAAYDQIEGAHWVAIAKRFKLSSSEKVVAAVKVADTRMLCTEAHDLLKGGPLPGFISIDGVERYPFKIKPWSPERSKKEFLHRFKKVMIYLTHHDLPRIIKA